MYEKKIIITAVTDEPEQRRTEKFKATLYVKGVPDRLGSGTRCGWGISEYAAIDDLKHSGHVLDAHELPVEYH